MGGQEEEVLEGGNVAVRVVRVGRTVRKPWLRSSPPVTSLLRYLRTRGYDASPAAFGQDGRGRQVLVYVSGTMADRMAPMTEDELHRLGRLIRRLHDLTAAYRPEEEPVWEVPVPHEREELVCHNDLAPWNLVRNGDSWTFVDRDGAGPGTRMGDLGYAAHGFVPLHEGGDPERDARRLRALADGHGCDEGQCGELPDAVLRRVRGMYDLLVEGARTRGQPWARLHAEGHADHWGASSEYVARHRKVWSAALSD